MSKSLLTAELQAILKKVENKHSSDVLYDIKINKGDGTIKIDINITLHEKTGTGCIQ